MRLWRSNTCRSHQAQNASDDGLWYINALWPDGAGWCGMEAGSLSVQHSCIDCVPIVEPYSLQASLHRPCMVRGSAITVHLRHPQMHPLAQPVAVMMLALAEGNEFVISPHGHPHP